MSAQSFAVRTDTLLLTGTVAANRFVKEDGTVSGAGENAAGVTRTAGVSGDRVAVDRLGSAVVESGAAVTAGASCKADSTGRAIDWVTSGVKLGVFKQAATAAGQFVEVELMPNVA